MTQHAQLLLRAMTTTTTSWEGVRGVSAVPTAESVPLWQRAYVRDQRFVGRFEDL
jgi:hypothetical protein